MTTISDIIEMFDEFEPLAKPCPICGRHPTFMTCDFSEGITSIRLGHTCGPKTGGVAIDKFINMKQLSQAIYSDFVIKNILEEMVTEWNKRVW